jgi:type VI secretion system protein ImpH
MAAESRNAGTVVVTNPLNRPEAAAFENLRQMLEDEPFRFHFFQAVRLLQRMQPERGPVGYYTSPQGETLRFTSRTTLNFPPSELHELVRDENGQLTMMVEFMGLCSAISVMPSVYTEYVLERNREKDYAMQDFMNLFNHRMISFFYRGWEKYRFFVEYEKSGEDRLSARLYDLLGLGTQGLRHRSAVPDDVFLYYVGNLARHIRTEGSLRQVLEDFFGVPVRIEQFAGAWRRLAVENQTCFTGKGAANERLGVGVVAGDEVWDHHGRIRVFIGPMSLDQYLKFLPGKRAYHELVAWLKFFSNGSFETEVKLVLERKDAPPCNLGSDGAARPQLGLVSWLKTRPLDRDPADASYLVQ